LVVFNAAIAVCVGLGQQYLSQCRGAGWHFDVGECLASDFFRRYRRLPGKRRPPL